MLDNMIQNPYPTKAEVLDIYNSINDGATATMLSGETAVGQYPVDSIKVMKTISENALNTSSRLEKKLEENGTAEAIKNLCDFLPITKLVAITVSGFAARIVSSKKIKQPILALTNRENLARSFNIYSGTKGIYFKTRFYKNSLEHIPRCLKYLWKINEINKKDMILVISLGYPAKGRRMNFLQTHYVKDLIKVFNWK